MSALSNHAVSRFRILLAALLVVALRLAALAAGDVRVWGFDFLRFFDAGWIVVFSVLPLLAALPQAGESIERWLRKTQSVSPRLLWAGLLLLAAAVAVFPMSTFYYGDGGPLVSEVYKIGAQADYSSSMLLNLQSAPLAGGLLHLLTVAIPTAMKLIGLMLPESPLFPFLGLALLAIPVLGGLLSLERNVSLRLPILLLLIGSGGVLLFFRYAEMYLPVLVAVTAYLLAAASALRKDRPVWSALLLFALSVAAHYMALALLPSLLYLLLHDHSFVRKATASPGRLLGTFGAMLALAFAGYFALGFAHSDSRVIMPLLPVESPAGTLSYTLLSPYHLFDLANIVVLLGIFPLLLFLFPPAAKADGKARQSSADNDLPEPLRFQSIAAFSFLLFLFFANTSLGLARDWDIAAPLGAMLVLLFVERWRSAAHEKAQAHAGDLLQAGIVAVLLVLPWIAVNVDADASTGRFTSIMTLDDEHMYGDYALSGYEALRKHAVHAENYESEGDILRRMIEVVGYTEQYRMLIVNALYFADRRPERYFELNGWALDRLAGTAGTLRHKGRERDYAIGIKQIDSLAAVIAVESITFGHYRELQPRVAAFARRSGCETAMQIYQGAELFSTQRFAQGIPVFQRVRDAGFRDPRVDGMYGSCLYVGGDRASGEREFQDGLQRYGDNPQYLFMVATSYLQRDGRFADARALLERALSLDPPADARAQITGLLRQLQAYAQEQGQ